MSDTRHQSIDAPTPVGHEPSEIRLKLIVVFAVGIVTIAAGVTILINGFMSHYRSRKDALSISKPMLFRDEEGQFPEPKLQRTSTDDMVQLRLEEREALRSYGWVDPKVGIAQIPIERALEIIAKRGLPMSDVKDKKSTESSKSP